MRQQRAEAEAAWFYGTLGGRVPLEGPAHVREAAAKVYAWLQRIPAFHRGAFSLWYTQREWPRALAAEFGRATSLVVRLECALHPCVGRGTAELEHDAAERLLALFDLSESPAGRIAQTHDHLLSLHYRAMRHHEIAVKALAKARRGAPSCVPAGATEGA